MRKQSMKIFISCHKPTAYIENDILKPIQLNCANNPKRLEGMLRDNEGENISDKNPLYCELTAQYWAWKNEDLDYYGFCHYRRYFNFSSTKYETDIFGNVVEKFPGEYTIKKYGLDEKTIRKVVGDNDIVITERKDISKMPPYAKSVLEQYYKAPRLHAEDIDLIQEIIEEISPEYAGAAKRFLNGRVTSFCNMYILKKKIFFEYCEWVFAILGEFCKRADMSHYSTEALRTPGHLSERLFGVYLTKKMSEEPDLKLKELQSVYFLDTEKQDELEPVFDDKAVPIVFAANNNFVPVFSVCLKSLIDRSSNDRNYDIVLIQSDISKENKQVLLDMIADRKNFSLRFYDASRLLEDYELEAKEHISVETYYRFLIQSAMPKYKKVLYIDCDTIIKRDVAELFDTNIDGYMLGAVRDADFLGQINGANAESMPYAKEDLEMDDPYAYFQAGVILFNEDEMRKAYSLKEWLDFATEPYRYSDQDVLNKYCQGRVKYLDMAWNMIFDCNHDRIEKVISFAPDDVQKEYKKAHDNPYIIHFAGFMKPWYSTTEEFANEFWLTARSTPYYEQLLERMCNARTYSEIGLLCRNLSFKGKTRNRISRLYRRVVPGPIRKIIHKN